MATPFCPSCDALTTESAGLCEECRTERPEEGWPQDKLVGRLFLDTYTVIKRLGSGGFGTVYLAENAEFGAKRAIKVLDSRYLHNDAVLRRFRREAKALYKLQSPYTVRVERWGRTDDGLYYLVMEHAEGETLRQLLDTEQRLDERRALSIVRQTAVALADAHALGILHRDLKPENLVIRRHPHEGDRVAVLDFGISKILGEDSATSRSGLVGTPTYMAPECWNPALGPQDIRSDLWSLGVVAFEMCVGALPFEGDRSSPDPMTTAFRIANLEADDVAETLDFDAVHSHTRKIVLRLLARDPSERYQTPGALLADIDRHPLWASAARKTSHASPAHRQKRLETADTLPGRLAKKPAESPAASLADTVEGLSSASGALENQLDSEPDLETLSFLDEPPESLRIRRTEDEVDAKEQRRGPSVWPFLVAVAALGMFWLASHFGGKLFGLDIDDDTDAGAVATVDVGEDEPDVQLNPGLPPTTEGLDGMGAVLIAGGPFTMGVDAPASLIPAHTVVLDPFYVDDQEVTAGMWLECVQRGGCSADFALNAANREGCRRLDGSSDDDALPINCVPWLAAEHYCRAFGRRLLTEAEWERAAAVGAETGTPQLVGTGLRAWVSDWFSSDYYDVSPTMNPTGSIFGTMRVVRGGEAEDEGTPLWAVRSSAAPDVREPTLSFRCAQSASRIPSR